MSLRKKLLLMLGSLMAASLLAVLVTLQFWQRSAQEQQIDDAKHLLKKRSELLIESVNEARQTLSLLAISIEQTDIQHAAIRDTMKAFNGHPSRFEDFFYVTLGGEAYPSSNSPFSVRDHAYIPLIQQGKPITEVTSTVASTGSALLLTVPVQGRNGQLTGTLGGTLPLKHLLTPTIRDIPRSKATLVILDAKGRVLASENADMPSPESAPGAREHSIAASLIPDLLDSRAGKTATPKAVSIKGERLLVLTSHLPDLQWIVIYALPESSLLLALKESRQLAWGMLLSLAAMIIIVTFFVQRYILAPLRALQGVQTRVLRGDLSARAPVNGNDELSDITSSFNHMVVALEKSEEKLRVVFETFPYPILLTRVADGRIIDVNPAFSRQYGKERSEIVGRTLKELGVAFDHNVLNTQDDELLTKGKLDRNTLQTFLPSGEQRWSLYSSRLVELQGEQVSISVTTDITELKVAEASLKESEASFTALFHLAPIPLSFVDERDGFSVTNRNEAWYTSFGYSQEAADGRNGNEIGVWETPTDRDRYIATAVAKGAVEGMEARLRREDGEILDCIIRGRFTPVGGRRVLMTAYLDVTEIRKAESDLRGLNRRLTLQSSLSDAIARAQTKFIANSDIRDVFNLLLGDMLKLTQSEYGFIGEVLYKANGAPYLKAYAITNIAWDEETHRFYDENAPAGLEFHNLKTLFGAALTSGEPVIANSPADDPRSGGLPPGHPPMHAFMGLPIKVGGHLVALAGMANRPGGYDPELVNWLLPLVSTAGQLIEARRTEKARDQAEEDAQRFRYMVDHANDAIFLMDGLRIVECNPAALKTFGCQREQFIGHSPVDFSPSQQADGTDTLQLAERFVQRVIEGGALRFEWLHYKADRTPFSAEVELCSFTERGTVRVMAVVRDITERKRIEAEVSALNASLEERVATRTSELATRNADLAQALSTLEVARARLAESEHRLRGVMAATGEGFWDWDIKTDRLYTSPRWCEILGFSPYDTEHEIDFFAQRLLDEERRSVMSAVQSCLEGKGPLRFEHRVRRRDGSIAWLLDRGDIAERDNEGKPIRMVGSISNITDRKQAELALAEAKEQAEVANTELATTLDDLRRAQDELVRSEKLASLGELVAGVAHELNTPIGNAVTVSSTLIDEQRQFTQLIKEGLTRSALSTFVETVGEIGEILERNLIRAAELIGGFKQLAVDQSSYQRRSFDLQEVVHEIALAMGPTVKQTQCKVNYDASQKLRLDSYPGPLGQVLMNLINNALIHAFDNKQPGVIDVKAQPVESGWLELTVSDNGRGIPPEHQKRIFDPFFTTRLGQGGSGLGLHIVFTLVTDLLGGRINVISTLGNGSVFRVRIPTIAPNKGDKHFVDNGELGK